RLHLDRRRRLPRVPRGAYAARSGCPDGGRLMRTPLVIGNWKMFGTLAEARPLATGVRDGLKRFKGGDVVLCPPYTALTAVGEIGTGVNATPQQAAEVHGYVRGLVSELASKEVAQGLRVLYGGSVKADNVDALMAESEIDGALVGGASLNAQGFVSIVKKAAH